MMVRKELSVQILNPSSRSITVKRYILRNNLLPYECVLCGMGPEWNGKPITLQLDHINGINNDHRLENLRILCPNCHSQTDTFAGKNITRKPKPDQLCVICEKPKLKNQGLAHTECRLKARCKINWPESKILKNMVEETSYSAVARELGVSNVSVHKRLKRYPA